MKKVVATIVVSLGIALAASAAARADSSVVIPSKDKVDWTETRTNLRYHSDPDPKKAGWYWDRDTIYRTSPKDEGDGEKKRQNERHHHK